MGVYGRMTGFPSAPMGARVTTQLATGRPTTCEEGSELAAVPAEQHGLRPTRLLRVRQREAVDSRVVRHALDGCQLERAKLLRREWRRRSGGRLGGSQRGDCSHSAHGQGSSGEQVPPQRGETVHLACLSSPQPAWSARRCVRGRGRGVVHGENREYVRAVL